MKMSPMTTIKITLGVVSIQLSSVLQRGQLFLICLQVARQLRWKVCLH